MRIAKAASHKLPGMSSLNVGLVCPVCRALEVGGYTVVPKEAGGYLIPYNFE